MWLEIYGSLRNDTGFVVFGMKKTKQGDKTLLGLVNLSFLLECLIFIEGR